MCVYDFLSENDYLSLVITFKSSPDSSACKFDTCKCPSSLSHAPCLVLHKLTNLKPENIQLVRNDYRVVHVPNLGRVMSLPCVS